MTLSSMTGFARAAGSGGGLNWQWEARSVNGKTLDVRSRLAPGYEALEPDVRTAAAEVLKRGNLQVTLAVGGHGARETVQLNEAVLDQVIAAGERLRARIGGEPLRADALLAMRGVLDIAAAEEDEAAIAGRNAAMLATLREALAALSESRRAEGARLEALLAAQVDRIEELVAAARGNPAWGPEAVRERLEQQLTRLLGTAAGLDPQRLHQEAALIATRADIQEELDRLTSHIAAARALLASGEAVGRKLDFLAQEFNREANTLCAKAVDRSLTATGLDLKTVIDQMREQVQNIE